MSGNEGIFTQPGPDGILGRGGEPEDATSPTIDGDGAALRETLVVAYPSPGHMRVARAIRHPQGNVEFQEQYRVPTASEVALLAQKGVKVGPGSMVTSQGIQGIGDAGVPGEVAAQAQPGVLNTLKGQPWLKLAGAVAVGAVGCWVAGKWVVPYVQKKWGAEADPDEVDDDDSDD
jgi:hypothetical protein